MKTFCAFLSALLFLQAPLAAQLIQEEWVSRYRGAGNGRDEGTDIAVDDSGYVYVTGVSDEGAGDRALTAKYDPAGSPIWFANFSDMAGSSRANALALDAAGNVYVTGRYSGANNHDYLTIKYDREGTELWAALYDGPAHDLDIAQDLVVDGDGNVYVTGESTDLGYNADIVTIRYDADGTEAWVARYDGPGSGSDAGLALALGPSGQIYVTGYLYRADTKWDYCTIRYDGAGNEVWVARYDGPRSDWDFAAALTVDRDENVYVTGMDNESERLAGSVATVKYDSDGVQKWVARYGTSNGYDEGLDIAADSRGNVIVAGYTDEAGSRDYLTIQYDVDGNESWVRRYSGPGFSSDEARAVVVDRFDNVYVTGGSQDPGTADMDYTTIKYDPAGNTVWLARYDGLAGGTDDAAALALDDDGNVYLTGTSYGGPESDFDVATVALSPTLYLSATPDSTVSRPGDLLGFETTLTNNTDSTLMFEGWTECKTPGGVLLSPLLGPAPFSLEARQVLSRHLLQPIPANAPVGGPYRYRVLVGRHPGPAAAEDGFKVRLVP